MSPWEQNRSQLRAIELVQVQTHLAVLGRRGRGGRGGLDTQLPQQKALSAIISPKFKASGVMDNEKLKFHK